MTWHWRCERADGTPMAAVAGSDSAFPTQSAAEAWMGDTWQELLQAGVDQATLLEEERVVYGPMSLRPA